MRRFLPFVIIGAVLLIAVGSGLLLFRSKYSSMPLKVAPGSPGAEPAHIRGATNARLTLEEFGDYQCKPCGLLAATLLKVEHTYGTQMRVVFRQFPLKMHAHALTAACAAEAAGLQGRFWEMHDLLYKNAPDWSQEALPLRQVMSAEAAARAREIFAGYAATLGLDMERFQKDMDSEEVRTRIRLDQERGASIGVDRTPVLLIDGVQIPFASFKESQLPGVIEAALSGSTPTPPPPPSPTPEQPR